MTAASDKRRSRGRWWLRAILAAPLLLLCCGGAALIGLIAYDRLLPPTDEVTLQIELREKTGEAQTVWLALDDLWGRLEEGQTALCSEETVTHPYFVAWRSVDRAAHPELAALADQLNSAIRDLHRAADIWTAICQRDETLIPDVEAREARTALTRAVERLAAVNEALATLP